MYAQFTANLIPYKQGLKSEKDSRKHGRSLVLEGEITCIFSTLSPITFHQVVLSDFSSSVRVLWQFSFCSSTPATWFSSVIKLTDRMLSHCTVCQILYKLAFFWLCRETLLSVSLISLSMVLLLVSVTFYNWDLCFQAGFSDLDMLMFSRSLESLPM